MNVAERALLAGAVGAAATTLLHEITRRVLPAAPRVDLLGMQALRRSFADADQTVPGNLSCICLLWPGIFLPTQRISARSVPPRVPVPLWPG